jgi:hypothetical protein
MWLEGRILITLYTVDVAIRTCIEELPLRRGEAGAYTGDGEEGHNTCRRPLVRDLDRRAKHMPIMARRQRGRWSSTYPLAGRRSRSPARVPFPRRRRDGYPSPWRTREEPSSGRMGLVVGPVASLGKGSVCVLRFLPGKWRFIMAAAQGRRERGRGREGRDARLPDGGDGKCGVRQDFLLPI